MCELNAAVLLQVAVLFKIWRCFPQAFTNKLVVAIGHNVAIGPR